MRWCVGLLIAALCGCTDEGANDSAPDAAGPRVAQEDVGAPPPGDGGRVVADGATSDDDAGAVTPDAAAPVADATPPPGCAGDDACGAGRVCHDGRCIDGTRCDAARACPAGRICVADICIADPSATGGLAAEPDRLVFTFSNVADRVIRTTTLVNVGDAPVMITALEIEGSPTFELTEPPALPLRLVPEQQAQVAVAYVADDAAADIGALLVRTDVAGVEPVEVRLTSDHKQVGRADPCLRIEPVRLNFGAVQRGNIETRSFLLLSCGQAAVQVNAIRRGADIFGQLSPHFQLDAPPAFPLVLPPGDQHQIDVTYEPGRAGLELGYWNVLSNDPASPEQRVDVSAIAAPPPLQDVEFHIRLEWNTDLTDVDLHLLGPNGQIWTCEGDCYFSNPNPSWGDPARWEDDPFLDTDDVDGFGPENINLAEPVAGTYRVIVHYWATHDGNEPDATIDIISFGQQVARYGPVHLSNVDDTWDVVDITWPGLQLRPLGQIAQQRGRGQICAGAFP